MLKFIVQTVVATLVVAAMGAFGLPWWLTAIAVVAGFSIVHLLWERFVISPFVHLGAMPIADDDPLMLDARKMAKETSLIPSQFYPLQVESEHLVFSENTVNYRK